MTDTSTEAVGRLAATYQSAYDRKVGRHMANPRYHKPDNRFKVLPDLLRALAAERDALQVKVGEARNDALDEAVSEAYGFPDYGLGFGDLDSLGRIKPGSPYGRGKYDASNAILALKSTTGE